MIVFDRRTMEKLRLNLEQLPRRVRIKHLRIGLNAWGGVVKAKAVARAPVETGLLKKSIIVKVTIPDASFDVQHHGKPARVIVGPSRNVVAPFIRKGGKTRKLGLTRATKLVLGGTKVRVRKPSRYAHLVEKGTKRSKARPFIAPAQRAGERQGMEKLAAKLRDGIAAEVAALRK